MIRLLVDRFDPLKGERLQIIDQDGNVLDKDLEPKLDSGLLRQAYVTMVLARAADEKAVILQRQGRLGAYPPNKGQEASQLGPVMAAKKDDWLVWAFRELSGLIWKGVPLIGYYLYWMGNEMGSHFPEGVKVTPGAVPVGSQVPHAVGISYASKLRGESDIALCFFGDGATSEGEFHEGMNLAGVFQTPTVFICQNNQYAISLPRSRQTASKTLAQKAIAYGFPGIQVDGNDLLSMYVASQEAIERARKGGGPTLIESFTYRLGDHTTSDDARRYRLEKELKEWEGKDPLPRFRAYLQNKGIWDDEKERKVWEAAQDQVEEAVKQAEATPPPSLEDVFRFTYAEMPDNLKEELEDLRSRLKEDG